MNSQAKQIDLSGEDLSTSSGQKRYAKALKLPKGEENALRVKFLADPRRTDENGKPMAFFPFNTHAHTVVSESGKTDRYSHPCGKIKFDECPECDRYYDLRKEANDIEGRAKAQAGKKGYVNREEMAKLMKSSPDFGRYSELEDLMKKFKPTRRGMFIVNVLGSDKFEALEASQQLIDAILGKTAYGDRPAEEGAYEKFKRDGYNIFSLRNPTEEEMEKGRRKGGWLKIWSSGDVSTGNYKVHAELAKMKKKAMIEGEESVVEVVVQDAPHPALGSVTLDQLPDIDSLAYNFGWTLEQIQAYVDSEGVAVPRFKRAEGGESSEPVAKPVAQKAAHLSPAPAAAPHPVVKQAQLDQVDDDGLDAAFEF